MRPSRSGGSVAFVVATAPPPSLGAPVLEMGVLFGKVFITVLSYDPATTIRNNYRQIDGNGWNLFSTTDPSIPYWADVFTDNPTGQYYQYKSVDSNATLTSPDSNVVFVPQA